MSLVSSNSEDDIRMTTAKAFKAYAARPGPAPTEALSVLCSLRGIGPASASLLLSVYRPEEVPFFSDEGYRWMMTIRYDAKCYGVYFASVRRLKDRLKDEGHSVPAADVERVGYVISKEVEEARVSARPSRLKRRAATEAPSAPKAGSKRKRATEKEGANA
ncbi:MAG: hypothetical protein M1826_005742 [Phylliscum demangeonii]|nr:MAG: hypothetical protein M1826_005742 [Phylliscum demangeonii]